MKNLSRLLTAVLLFTLLPQGGHAAETNVTITMKPHCTEDAADIDLCPSFVQYDAQSWITNGLAVGDILDIDIVLQNPSSQSIQSIQSWIAYDPAVLQGRDVRIVDEFPLVAPGEQAFSPEQGLVKIGASNVRGGMDEQEFVFARLQFDVIAEIDSLIPIRFHEFSLLGQEGRTKALVIESGRTVNVLKTRPMDLLLYFGADPPPSLLPPPAVQPPPGGGVTQPPITTFPPTTVQPTPTIPSDGFSNIQPQGLRITTEGDRVYLLWSPLADSRIRGYNIYYGTVPGRYVHRRTVSSGSDGVTIRDLPEDQQYYFAITAFDGNGRETEFSYEVAVVVGDPSTSTAPFTLSTGEGVIGSTSPLGGSLTGGTGRVPGGTGLPLRAVVGIAFIALLGSAYRIRFRKRSRL